MKIIVTQEDINQGEAKSYSRCPVQLAVARAGFEDVEVFEDYLTFTGLIFDARRTLIMSLPGTAQQFIEAFDDGRTVEPFEFDLAVEDE